MNLRERIENEFFKGAAVQLNWDTGQNVTEEGVVTLGGRAGPVVEEVSLLHEMAHFVEIDEDRMTRHGWGLRLPTQIVLGQRVSEPMTTQPTLRECRVVAYQANLTEYFGIKRKGVGALVAAFVFMPDFSLIPVKDGLPLRDRDRRRLQWCARQVNKIRWRPEYQVEAFRAEWWRRNGILKARVAV